MGDFATTTSFSTILVNFYSSNTSTSDTEGVSVLTRAIDRAESVVKSALSVRYSMPFTTVPPLVRTLSEDIAARYAILAVNNQDGKSKNQYLDEFESAMDTLKMIREGKMGLALTNGSLVATKSGSRILSSTEDYTPIFGLDDPASWQRDTDEVSDTEDSRA